LITNFSFDRNNCNKGCEMNTANYPLTLLYDGNCPVCNLEMDNLWARNSAGLLRFVDISTPDFDPRPYNASIAEMNALIHAQRPDGSLVIGVEVFRLAYSAVGLGSYTRFTGWPIFKHLIDLAYAIFARNRYTASRIAMPVISWIAARRAVKRSKACAQGHCELPTSNSTRSAS
jgi:predicted DCC family thiol-disulfide oxidoreductase YuxK